MVKRIFADTDQQHRWETIHAEHTPEDARLAELLMCMAFFGDPHAHELRGIGPLYITQAYYIRRYFRDDFKKLLET